MQDPTLHTLVAPKSGSRWNGRRTHRGSDAKPLLTGTMARINASGSLSAVKISLRVIRSARALSPRKALLLAFAEEGFRIREHVPQPPHAFGEAVERAWLEPACLHPLPIDAD